MTVKTPKDKRISSPTRTTPVLTSGHHPSREQSACHQPAAHRTSRQPNDHARADGKERAAPPGESPLPARPPSTDPTGRRPRPGGQPDASAIPVDADSPTTNASSPSTPGQERRHGDNPNPRFHTSPQADRTPLDRPRRSDHPPERRPPQLTHRGAARSSQEHAGCRQASESKTVETAHQRRQDQRRAPSTGHVQPTIHDQHESP